MVFGGRREIREADCIRHVAGNVRRMTGGIMREAGALQTQPQAKSLLV